jgi:hypothetical protein
MTLVDELRSHAFKTDFDIDAVLAVALARKRKIGPVEIGRRLGLDAATRDELKIRNIQALVKQRKIERDRKRWKLPRAVYEAESAERTKPWEKEGII